MTKIEPSLTISFATARLLREFLPAKLNRTRKLSLGQVKRLEQFLQQLDAAEAEHSSALAELAIAGGAQDPDKYTHGSREVRCKGPCGGLSYKHKELCK